MERTGCRGTPPYTPSHGLHNGVAVNRPFFYRFDSLGAVVRPTRRLLQRLIADCDLLPPQPRQPELNREVSRTPELNVGADAIPYRNESTVPDLVAPQLALEPRGLGR